MLGVTLDNSKNLQIHESSLILKVQRDAHGLLKYGRI